MRREMMTFDQWIDLGAGSAETQDEERALVLMREKYVDELHTDTKWSQLFSRELDGLE
jgi:hypothetical protein